MDTIRRALFPPPEDQPNPADAWNRREWVWVIIYYATLLLSGIIAWRNNVPQWVLWLTLLAAVWQTPVFIAAHWGWHLRQHPVVAILHQSVAIGIWYLLVGIHPVYYIHLFSLFAQVNQYLSSPWSIIFNVVLATSVALPQVMEEGITSATILLVLLIGGASTILGLWINSIIRQSAERRALIEQLERTRTELAAAERREGVLEERQRLAHEIHDTLAQGFISVIMHLEAYDASQAPHHLSQAEAVARQGLQEARRVVQDLRPDVLENAPLPEAVTRVAETWSRQSGMLVTTAVTGTYTHLHPEIETTVIRAVQEALANVQKHAAASEVTLTLSYMTDLLMLDVQDDGVGMDHSSPPQNGGGYGLVAMRQRVAQVGGVLTIESEPDEGTTLVLQIPY